MTNFVDLSVNDGALAIFEGATELHLCSGDPFTRAAVLTNTLANYPLAGGDYTRANGDVSGRKTTVAAKTGNNATGTGTVDVVCGINGTDLVFKSNASNPQAVTSGNPVDSAAFQYESRQVS